MESDKERRMLEKPATITTEMLRYSYLPKVAKIVFAIASASLVGLGLSYVFSFSIAGHILLTLPYYWLYIGIVTSGSFLILPARKKDKTILPWYDLTAAILAFGICIYFVSKSWLMLTEGWAYPPLGFVLMLLIAEGGRRMGGPIFFTLVIMGMFFPLYTGHMPSFLFGLSLSLSKTAEVLVFTAEGLLGFLTRTMSGIVLSFLVFAGFMMASGAGEFFLKFATALLGKYRGGPAKVAVISSGFFGSLSGSATANIASTGSVTIPAMKRMGYAPHYAAAVEACASTGGVIMPPVMGLIAFIMVEITGMSYGVIIVAAAIPAFL